MTNKKNLWPAGIIIVFITFFIYLFGFLIFSQFHQSDLVTENYYEEEMAYQDQIERITRNKNLSQDIQLNYNSAEHSMSLIFPQELNPNSVSGSVVFFRPSDAGQDHAHPIKLNADHTQDFDVAGLISGLWRVKIFWLSDGAEYYDEKILKIN
jgi:hypothetical protein